MTGHFDDPVPQRRRRRTDRLWRDFMTGLVRWVVPPGIGLVSVQVVGILTGGPWVGLLAIVIYTAALLALIRWRWL